jgi:fluoride exporter
MAPVCRGPDGQGGPVPARVAVHDRLTDVRHHPHAHAVRDNDRVRENPGPEDPDVDVTVAERRAEVERTPVSVLAAVAAGGAIGAVARWGIGVALPAGDRGFPWATFLINVTGGALIGVLMVLVTDVFPHRRLLRPFAGVGILGGFTTFSTYAVDVERRLTGGAAAVALLYLVATVVVALAATAAAVRVTRAQTGPRP